MTTIKEKWAGIYSCCADTLHNMKKIKSAGAVFNTNIDAVLKISGQKLAGLARENGLSGGDLSRTERFQLLTPQDVIKGIFRCFTRGIAEEWLAEDAAVYHWMAKNLGYDRLQLGGQAGIVANALAVCGLEQVLVHCSSLPAQQAQQFLPIENLRSFDEKGQLRQASEIDRRDDLPLIHWIIEFDRGDKLEYDGLKVICPKSNRFIATYDPLNSRLIMDENYLDYVGKNPPELMVLSGYHALTAEKSGIELAEGSIPVIESWQNNGSLVHLEVASTQDREVRKVIVEKIASRADSIGLNERETLDVLQVIGEERLAETCEANPSGVNLLKAIIQIKKKVGCRRLQLHMFGLYITLQDKDFPLTPEQNRRGMCLAATAAAGKAGTGSLNEAKNLLWAHGREVCDCGLEELRQIAVYTGEKSLYDSGIGMYEGFDVIAIPTILVEKPLTLVGMGDTISSLSLAGALY